MKFNISIHKLFDKTTCIIDLVLNNTILLIRISVKMQKNMLTT